MPRVTNAPASRERRKRRLELAKGFRGGRSKQFRQATEAVDRAQRMSTVDRINRKRTFRTLWIQRINTAAREHDMTYSRLIEGLTKAGVLLNRKVLADIAVQDADGFKAIVETARAALNKAV